MAPLYVKRVSFPPRECAPVLAVVKQTSLDNGCGPALIEGRREVAEERIVLLAGVGVGSCAAGPGSDFSEVPVQGLEPATLEPVVVPVCPPGPVAVARASLVIWRQATSDSRRLRQRRASMVVLPAASLRR